MLKSPGVMGSRKEGKKRIKTGKKTDGNESYKNVGGGKGLNGEHEKNYDTWMSPRRWRERGEMGEEWDLGHQLVGGARVSSKI